MIIRIRAAIRSLQKESGRFFRKIIDLEMAGLNYNRKTENLEGKVEKLEENRYKYNRQLATGLTKAIRGDIARNEVRDYPEMLSRIENLEQIVAKLREDPTLWPRYDRDPIDEKIDKEDCILPLTEEMKQLLSDAIKMDSDGNFVHSKNYSTKMFAKIKELIKNYERMRFRNDPMPDNKDDFAKAKEKFHHGFLKEMRGYYGQLSKESDKLFKEFAKTYNEKYNQKHDIIVEDEIPYQTQYFEDKESGLLWYNTEKICTIEEAKNLIKNQYSKETIHLYYDEDGVYNYPAGNAKKIVWRIPSIKDIITLYEDLSSEKIKLKEGFNFNPAQNFTNMPIFWLNVQSMDYYYYVDSENFLIDCSDERDCKNQLILVANI